MLASDDLDGKAALHQQMRSIVEIIQKRGRFKSRTPEGKAGLLNVEHEDDRAVQNDIPGRYK